MLESIATDIAMYPPERGGVLLGPIGKYCVSQFIFDHDAAATGATFTPSLAIGKQVRAAELATGREFKGLVHSHPGTLDRPSGQDIVSIQHALECNPHLATYFAPIITAESFQDSLDSHELALARGKLSFFLAQRTRDGTITIMSRDVHAVPLRDDLIALAKHYGAIQEPECFLSHLGSTEIAAGCVVLPDQTEIMVMVSELYPGTPPLVLITDTTGKTEQLQISWQLDIAAGTRLLTALSDAIPSGVGELARAYGPTRTRPFTLDATRAAVAGWASHWYRVPQHEPSIVEEVQSGLTARTPISTSETVQDSCVLVVGAGSVGSMVVEQLVRTGITSIVVVDPQVVEASNLSRSVYEARDIGQNKVDALARRMLGINPGVSIRPLVDRLEGIDPSTLLTLCGEADVVVAATDDPQTQLIANRFAYSAGTPAVYIGLFDGAEGGEVIFTLPNETACYLCAASNRAAVLSDNEAPRLDYSTGRLSSVRAVAADVHLVTCAGVKIALCLLDSGVGGNGFLDAPRANGQSYVFFALTPNFLFFPQVFQDTASQHAYQTVWARPVRASDCPVCGDDDKRQAPLAHPLESPSVDHILDALSKHADDHGQ